jgi:pyruvate carboxylase subunit B
VQPDVRSLAHALKGTGYTLDMDVSRVREVETLLTDLMQDYAFNPTTTSADARVLGFPMPGGAIGPNVHMMVKAGILDRYSEVLEEFPVVVEAGGAWTSVTPGSQQYWLQAFNNVMYGRWEKIDAGYGKAVLGYFGRTPLPPDPEVVGRASEQLELEPFDGDPLEVAPKNVEPARQALRDAGLPVTDESTFLVMACMVPGKKVELNEGIRLLQGRGKIDIPLRKKEEPKPAPPTAPAAVMDRMGLYGPVTSQVAVRENGHTRTFTVTVEPLGEAAPAAVQEAPPAATGGRPVHSTFAGLVEIVDVLVGVGDRVDEGGVIAKVEAMKAQHDIRSPFAGSVTAVHVKIGDEIDSSKPIVTIA